ncbi:MAG: hypothetical protein ACE5GD_11555, partial [Candidatus Geothermarchaeales archaeon]
FCMLRNVPIWLSHLKDKGIEELTRGFIQPRVARKSLCPLCRGVKLLCGKPACPVTLQYYTFLRLEKYQNVDKIEGNSPPSIFVGRFGYPKVKVGPMVPPVRGDTSIYDYPEKWLDKSLEEILELRSMLVHGRFSVHVKRPWEARREYDKMVEMSLSSTSPETELIFEKRPTKTISFSKDVVLFGPSAPLKSFNLGTLKTDFRLERRHYDTDLRANEAVIELYLDRVPISRIQRAFSVGSFGIEKNRRLVPTRWSITATDSIISQFLIDKIKYYPWMNECRVYENVTYDNVFVVLLIPSNWSYEWLEAWQPNTFWNRIGVDPVIYNDHEHFQGRTTYAYTGGCYYAARLAVAEKLEGMGRQAAAILFREVHPGYLFPVGVWNVRENVRRALSMSPKMFSTLNDALKYVVSRLTIPLKKWIHASEYLHELLLQRKITEFTG